MSDSIVGKHVHGIQGSLWGTVVVLKLWGIIYTPQNFGTPQQSQI